MGETCRWCGVPINWIHGPDGATWIHHLGGPSCADNAHTAYPLSSDDPEAHR